MMRCVAADDYHHFFPASPHCFLSREFIAINAHKVDEVLYLLSDRENCRLGLVVGRTARMLRSPFSAPFGGFHFRSERHHTRVMDEFIDELQTYAITLECDVVLTLPPFPYHPTFYGKMLNVLLRKGFVLDYPEIHHWADLSAFSGRYPDRTVHCHLRNAENAGLVLARAETPEERELAYRVVADNRALMNRPICMTLSDVEEVGEIIPLDIFVVKDRAGVICASAFVYQGQDAVAQPVFWADTLVGRSSRAMDFLLDGLWRHYKAAGFTKLDAGISSVGGIPNDGLIQFKENHGCRASPRFTLSWRFA